MPKPLQTPPPSSSVSRLLDFGAVARAVAEPSPASPVQERPPAVIDQPRPSHDRPCLNREFVLTRSTDDTFARLLELYRRSTGARLTASHVLRVVLKGIAFRIDTLELEARRLGPLRLPSNARGRDQQREQFEARIADAFVRGMDCGGPHNHSED